MSMDVCLETKEEIIKSHIDLNLDLRIPKLIQYLARESPTSGKQSKMLLLPTCQLHGVHYHPSCLPSHWPLCPPYLLLSFFFLSLYPVLSPFLLVSGRMTLDLSLIVSTQLWVLWLHDFTLV